MRIGTALSLLAVSAAAVVLVVSSASSRAATIDWMDIHQVIDGFGASCADFYEPLPEEMADFFFNTSGIGLSLLRIQVIPSEADCKSFFGPDGGECVEVPSGATILKGELAIAKQAVSRGITIWSTPWSPPASMKSNKSFTNGGKLLPVSYSAWAASLAGYVKLLESNGVPIYAMSLQNEPDLSTDYGSAIYSPQEIRDLVPFVYSAFQSPGIGNTRIMIAEASRWDFNLTEAAMADSNVAREVGILAAHGYGPAKSAFRPANYGKHVWQTEDSSQSAVYDGSMADALLWASKIHRYLTVAEVNAWHWWFLSDGPKYGNGIDNAALTDLKLNYPKRSYMTGQWSKFVRPGWSRIGVSYSGPLEISAFKSADGNSFAIVAVNAGGKAIHQSFTLKGFASRTVIPWITSTELSLAAQAPVSVADGTFTYAVPASSVVTFAGNVAQP